MAVKCDICGQEIANSEEMKAHKERDHTLEERRDEKLEKPDMMDKEQENLPAPIVPGKN